MSRYTCRCNNITLEFTKSDNENSDNKDTRDSYLNQIQTNLEDRNDLSKDLIDLLKTNFLSNESNFETNLFNSEVKLKSFDSQLKIKYPLLIGVLEKTFNEATLKFTKCMICNVLTHCDYIQKQLTNKMTSSEKKSILENKHFSDKSLSYSTNLPKSSDTTSQYSVSTHVNNKNMILNADNEKITHSDNYSSVYDIILDDFNETSLASSAFNDLVININQVPIFEQRRFLNQIQEKFQIPSHVNQAKEEALKNKLETLVKFLTNTDDNYNKNNKTNEQSSNSAPVQLLAEKIVLKDQFKKKPKKYDESALSSSVFEMEEIDDFDNEDKFLDNDQDSQDESDDPDKQEVEKSILKKRNSNISDSEFRNDMNRLSAKLNFSKNPINRAEQLSSQYSCSLPRDIPVMMNHHVKNIAKTYKDNDNNENFFNPVKEQHKHHKKLITNSFKQPNNFLNYNFNTSNDVEGDDDLFEEDADQDNQENFELEEEDTTNMGHAISSLASSIVIKDGRELFGGVPSRRVPINSISKSCFE